MTKSLLSLLCSLFTIILFAQDPPKREMRGAWIATFTGIDWPNRNQTPAQQRAAFITIADHHKATGMNTIYLQMRSQCDAMYPSSIEPWSADLTATQGKAPNPLWDPLQFAIDECHKRGMELHAWLNPYRAVSNAANLPGFAANHVAKVHPEWVLQQGVVKFLNPALAQVRDHIMTVIEDIVQRYDIDGIHFDDYFYPQQTGTPTYNDDASFAADPRGFTNRADWRRDNVNLLIKRAYERIKELKPWVKFGVSPSGIYRNSTNPAIGTNTSGLEHYTSLYADSKKWLEQGWVDYIAPQVYWYMGQPGANYSVIVPWWNSVANGRHIYIGMAGYKVNDPAQGANWANPSQIPNEVRFNRTFANVSGQAIYNTNSLRSATTLGFRDSLRLNFYKKPALLPTMLWRDATPPSPATALTALKYANDSVVLNWVKPANTSNELDKAKRFVIYRSENPVIDITNANNILAITNNDTAAYADKTITANTTYYYTITALDRFHNESETSNNAATIAATISCPGDQQLFSTTSCSVALPDYTSVAVVNNAGAAKGIIITQTPAAGTMINAGTETLVSVSVKDAAGNANSCSFNVTVTDTVAPVITTCAENKTVNTSKGICGALVNAGVPVVTDNCSVTSIVGTRSDGQPLNAVYPTGVTTINWIATDAAGNTATCSQTITVVDNEAPVITAVSVNPSKLNAPNHKMHDVTVSYKTSDNCGVVSAVLSVTSNEPENGLGDGDTDHDWEIIDDHHVQLRAERSGTGDGRIYTITITVTDEAGNTTVETVNVTVPHNGRPVVTTADAQMNDHLAGSENNLKIRVLSNPSRDRFTLITSSNSDESLLVKVTDKYGRMLETKASVAANGTITFGGKYVPGVYTVEIIQGNTKRSLRLIKQ